MSTNDGRTIVIGNLNGTVVTFGEGKPGAVTLTPAAGSTILLPLLTNTLIEIFFWRTFINHDN